MRLCSIFKRGFSACHTLQHTRKFYKNVTLECFDEAPRDHYKFIVKLDGKEVQTPNKNVLATPTEELGVAVAAEFLTQKDYMKPATMPLFGLAKSAIDVDADENQRRELEKELIGLFENDSIWGREKENEPLFRLQNEHLNPVIQYINKLLGSNVEIREGANSFGPNESDINQLSTYLHQLNNWKLISLEKAAFSLKSTSLAIALMQGQITIEEAMDLAKIKEHYQQKLFGNIDKSFEMNEKAEKMTISAAKNFFSLSHE